MYGRLPLPPIAGMSGGSLSKTFLTLRNSPLSVSRPNSVSRFHASDRSKYFAVGFVWVLSNVVCTVFETGQHVWHSMDELLLTVPEKNRMVTPPVNWPSV